VFRAELISQAVKPVRVDSSGRGVQGSYEEIVAAEARKRSELEPGVQKNTRGRPVRI
jgi:hypothetical protein